MTLVREGKEEAGEKDVGKGGKEEEAEERDVSKGGERRERSRGKWR